VAFTTRSNLTAPFVGTNYGSRGVEWWDPKVHNPYVLNFNAGVQYEFLKNYLLDVTYQDPRVSAWSTLAVQHIPDRLLRWEPTQQTAVIAASQNYRPFRSSAISIFGRISVTARSTRDGEGGKANVEGPVLRRLLYLREGD